jgi:hypothetical protein
VPSCGAIGRALLLLPIAAIFWRYEQAIVTRRPSNIDTVMDAFGDGALLKGFEKGRF